ncbi:MAG TPA: PD-(D/E)XK nuclease family protein, partial [Candidatus Brocadiia bacterium]|nr:PD-(D/E)XK nuclease family protein [Candidatus Brocadiia bacterium]
GYFDEEDQPLAERLRACAEEARAQADGGGEAGSLAELARDARRALWLMTGLAKDRPAEDDPALARPPEKSAIGLLGRLEALAQRPGETFAGLLVDLSHVFAQPAELADRSVADFLKDGARLCVEAFGPDVPLPAFAETMASYLETKTYLRRPEREGVYLLDLREMAGARFRKAVVAGLTLDAFPGVGARPELLGPEVTERINRRLASRGLPPLRDASERRARAAALWADAAAAVEEEIILSTPFNRETRRDEQDSVAVLDTAALFGVDADLWREAAQAGLGDDPCAGRLPLREFILADHMDQGPGTNPDAAAAEAWRRWQEGKAGPGSADKTVAFRRGVVMARRAWLWRAGKAEGDFRAREELAAVRSPWDAWTGRLTPDTAKRLKPDHISPTAAENFHTDRMEYLYGHVLSVAPAGAGGGGEFSALLRGALAHRLASAAVGGKEGAAWAKPKKPAVPEKAMKEMLDAAYRLGLDVGRQRSRGRVEWELKQALEGMCAFEPATPWHGMECLWEAPLTNIILDMGEGRTWRLEGYIDRLARDGDELWVVDYKMSSGEDGFGEDDFRRAGRRLQGPLYRFVVACLPPDRLGVAGGPEARVRFDAPQAIQVEVGMKYQFLRAKTDKKCLGYPFKTGSGKNKREFPPLAEEAPVLRDALAAPWSAFSAHGDFRPAASPGPFAALAWLARAYDAGGASHEE